MCKLTALYSLSGWWRGLRTFKDLSYSKQTFRKVRLTAPKNSLFISAEFNGSLESLVHMTTSVLETSNGRSTQKTKWSIKKSEKRHIVSATSVENPDLPHFSSNFIMTLTGQPTFLLLKTSTWHGNMIQTRSPQNPFYISVAIALGIPGRRQSTFLKEVMLKGKYRQPKRFMAVFSHSG